MVYTIALLPGDGIGPEVITEAVRVLEAVGRRYRHTFLFREGPVGGQAIDDCGTALPGETLQLTRVCDAVLFGAVGGPKWNYPEANTRPEDGLLALRKSLSLFANLRPVKVFPQLVDSSPLKPSLLRGVDILVIRELTGGLYFGKPKRRWNTKRGRRGLDTMRYTEQEVERVLRVGFELARTRRRKLTSVDKANVLESSRLWRDVASELGREYSDVQLEHMLVDTAAMQLMRAPAHFDVMVTENTFGDILTDEAAVLSGSMGMLPSASLASVPGPGRCVHGLYEPIHGSAPDISGKGIANPIGAILSMAMMLRISFDLEDEARAVEDAVSRVLSDGYRTADISVPGEEVLETSRIGDLIARAVE